MDRNCRYLSNTAPEPILIFRRNVLPNGVLVEGFYPVGFWWRGFIKHVRAQPAFDLMVFTAGLRCIFVEDFQPIKLFASIKYICIMRTCFLAPGIFG